MFYGPSTLGALTNTAALNLLRANTYAAARQLFGSKGSEAVINKVIESYVHYVQPKTNRALTVFEISRDPSFKKIAEVAESGGSAAATTDALISPSDWSFSGSIFGSIPNYLLYGGVGVGAYLLWRNKGGAGIGSLFKRKAKTRSRRSTKRRIATSRSKPVIGIAASRSKPVIGGVP